MFKDYINDETICGVKRQYNIMVLIGNGFDISILKKYRKDNLITSYSKFYDFLQYKGFDEKNLLYKKVSEDKELGKENWSDFELSLAEMVKGGYSLETLEVDLRKIQDMFLLFLNDIVTPEVLMDVNRDAEKYAWASNSISKFLGDLKKHDYEKIEFPLYTNHYSMYNFLFVNLNYTFLFDNYIYLDKSQFDPHKHKTVDTNFDFYPNPNGYVREDTEHVMNEDTRWSSFIMADVVHPHGYQSIPRSLIFGIEDENSDLIKERFRFNKSYWVQTSRKYRSYIDGANLHIIYGASLGKTDGWWWRSIYDDILSRNSELIIYYYSDTKIEEEFVKDLFIQASWPEGDQQDHKKVKDRIYVVVYDEERKLNMFSFDKIKADKE